MPTKFDTRLPFLSPNILLIISGVFFGAICTFYISPLLNLVEQLGWRIPRQDDLITDYITSLFWATFLGACIIFSPVWQKDKGMLLFAWCIKCFVALFVILFYESHYPSDSFGYYSNLRTAQGVGGFLDFETLVDATVAHKRMFRMDRIILLYNKNIPYFLADSYHSLKITFSMIGLMAMYLFYRTSIIITKRENRMFFWVLVLFPSLLIYTSRIGKESLMLFCIAVYAAGLVNWHFKRKIIYIFIGLTGLFACSYLRIWVTVVLIIPLFFYVLYATKDSLSKVAGTLLLGILFLFAYDMLFAYFNLKSIDDIYAKLEFVALHSDSGGSALNRASVIINGPLDVIKFAPSGIFTALFRPLPWDVKSMLGLLAGMEGLLLLYLFFRAMIQTQLRELKDPILVWAIVLVLSWALLYGFAIQNFGTGVRWKTQVLPIFLGLLLYLGRSRSKHLKQIGSKTLNLPVLKK